MGHQYAMFNKISKLIQIYYINRSKKWQEPEQCLQNKTITNLHNNFRCIFNLKEIDDLCKCLIISS